MGSAVFYFPYQALVSVLIMLFYPLSDRHWRSPITKTQSINYLIYLVVFLLLAILITSDAISIKLVIFTMLVSAIPEEWFFRAYFQSQLLQLFFSKKKSRISPEVTGITLTSILFSSIHAIMQSNPWLIALIFVPSMLFGYLYHKTHDLVLVILVHLICNIFLYWFISSALYTHHFNNFFTA